MEDGLQNNAAKSSVQTDRQEKAWIWKFAALRGVQITELYITSAASYQNTTKVSASRPVSALAVLCKSDITTHLEHESILILRTGRTKLTHTTTTAPEPSDFVICLCVTVNNNLIAIDTSAPHQRLVAAHPARQHRSASWSIENLSFFHVFVYDDVGLET